MMRVLIVDDEAPARDRLRRLLTGQPEVNVCGEAGDGDEAVRLNKTLKPDLVLLDVRMPGVDGLAAAEAMAAEAVPPAIVFCTAYDEFALRAFKVNASDYLLKPVREQDLLQALERARQQNRLQQRVADTDGDEHLTVRTHRGVEKLALDQIYALRADHKYVSLLLFDGELLTDQSLKALEQGLGERFLRIHRNALVNKRYVRGVDRQTRQPLLRFNRDLPPLPISRRHLPDVIAFLQATGG